MQLTLMHAGSSGKGPFAASLLLHVSLLLPLLLVVQPEVPRSPKTRAATVTILAPALVDPHRRVSGTPVLRSPALPRTLVLPPLPRNPLPTRPVLEAPPVVSQVAVSPPPVFLSIKTPLPPPIVTTGSFPSTAVPATPVVRTGSLRTGEFSPAEAGASSRPGKLVAQAAGFSSVRMGGPSPRASNPSPESAFAEVKAERTSVTATTIAGPQSFAPVEILYKPKPIYTEQARAAQIEGDVILEVVFTAGGLVLVQRALSTLGYGLEERGFAAARAIQFRPASRNGQHIDSPATVHIHFELAY